LERVGGVTWIKVLAPSRRERGQAFELFVQQILDACDLSPGRTRLKVTGSGPLLDIWAKRRKDAIPILGTCRALSREVTLEDVKRFYQRLRRERKRAKRLRGFFLSCTPFSLKVLTWYHGLDHEARETLELLNPDAIIARLADQHRLLPLQDAEAEAAASSMLPPGPRFLATLNGNMYWVQTLLVNRRPRVYFVLEGKGAVAPRPVAQGVKRADPSLRDKQLFDLDLRWRTLLDLCAQDPRTADELCRSMGVQPQEMLAVLQWLVKEGVITGDRSPGKSRRLDRYRVQRGFPIFLHLARYYVRGRHRFRFLATPFAAEMITTGLASYLEDRFRLKLPAEDVEAVVNLLSLSPSALVFALSSGQQYMMSEREMNAKFIPDGERERLREAGRARFISDLSLRAMSDSLHDEFPSLLKGREVRAYLARTHVKAAALPHALFSLRGYHLHTLPGSRPTTEAELNLELGTVMRLIQEYDQAVQCLNQAIRDLKDPARLKTAWNTKGLCFFSKRRYQEAIECFNEAIKLDANLKQAWFNKAVCLREVGDGLGALRCVQRALELDPTYKEANDLLRRFQSS
jgi:tetratricopeptide (TPR) repeat protein